MTDEEVRAEIDNLIREIKFYNKKYFQQSLSLISDYDYDCLVARLTELENAYPHLKRSDSPNNNVDEAPVEGFKKYEHTSPMLSLKKTYSEEDLDKFFCDMQKEGTYSFICEPKLDGISVNVNYKNGVLNTISTRGNGSVGDDITCNRMFFKNVPQMIPAFNDIPSVDIRGEAFMCYTDFERLNKKLEAAGEKPLSNPRNAASGILKTLPGTSTQKDNTITVFFYDMFFDNRLSMVASRADIMLFFAENNIPCDYNYRLCNDKKEVIGYINFFQEKRHNIDYPTDGVVIKINELEAVDVFGATNKHPRWAIAFKYKPDSVSSRLKSIDYQVGRSGLITPVAVFEPVELAGTIVERASLYNRQNMSALDLHEDDYVIIQKSGEIIPRVTGVDISRREDYSEAISFIKTCPCCKTQLRFENELAFCDNVNCKARIISSLTHFVGKNAMNIRSLGPRLISLFVEKGLVRTYEDLYKLKFNDIVSLPGLNIRSAQKIIDEIKNSKSQPFSKFLFALGIEGVGEVAAKNIASHYKNIEELKKANYEDLIKIDLIGENIAINIINYLRKNVL